MEAHALARIFPKPLPPYPVARAVWPHGSHTRSHEVYASVPLRCTQAIELLAACQEHSKYFSDFDFQQLIDLAKELTILYFKDGETVLFQGEPATFFGVILKGALVPVAGDRPLGPLRTVGEVIGEMALFQGGTRGSSIVAREDGYLAVFAFAQLGAR